MSKNDRPIAVIDSGVGGVSVLRHLMSALPNENFIYLGDTANAPYGSKTSEEVCALTLSNIEKLISEHSVKAVVIACNTATGAAANEARTEFPSVPIIGIEPAIKPAVTHSKKENPTVLVMATPLTLKQDKFTSLALRYNPNASIIALPCPGLSDAVESCASESELRVLLSNLFKKVKADDIDSLVLGCTHYPLISQYIAEFFPNVEIYDGGLGTALQTVRRLREMSLLSSDREKGKLIILSSSNNSDFVRRAEKYLVNSYLEKK